jgi:hypothetical protein
MPECVDFIELEQKVHDTLFLLKRPSGARLSKLKALPMCRLVAFRGIIGRPMSINTKLIDQLIFSKVPKSYEKFACDKFEGGNERNRTACFDKSDRSVM